jgi:hypothetical protein
VEEKIGEKIENIDGKIENIDGKIENIGEKIDGVLYKILNEINLSKNEKQTAGATRASYYST